MLSSRAQTKLSPIQKWNVVQGVNSTKLLLDFDDNLRCNVWNSLSTEARCLLNMKMIF